MARITSPLGKLFLACATGDVDSIRKKTAPGGPWRAMAATATMGEGRSALHHAIHFSHLQAAESLIDAGADPNALDDHGRTPLHVAACASDIVLGKELVAMLARRGADFAIRDNEGHLASNMDVGFFCGGTPETQEFCAWIAAFGESLAQTRSLDTSTPSSNSEQLSSARATRCL